MFADRLIEVSNKAKLMAALFPKGDDKENQEISQDTNNVVEEHGNLEAHEILMITKQRKSRHDNATAGHTHSKCGQTSWSK